MKIFQADILATSSESPAAFDIKDLFYSFCHSASKQLGHVERLDEYSFEVLSQHADSLDLSNLSAAIEPLSAESHDIKAFVVSSKSFLLF